MSQHSARTRLAASLTGRTPTWEVAGDILRLLERNHTVPATLKRELRALADTKPYYWSMSRMVEKAPDAAAKLGTFAALFPSMELPEHADTDPQVLFQLIQDTLAFLGAPEYQDAGEALRDVKYLADLTGYSRKHLRKRLRFLRDLQDKAETMRRGVLAENARRQAKSRLAYQIDAARCDDLTLSFCAYLASRANRRSIFQFEAQSKAQDLISRGLEDLLFDNPGTAWDQVALVKPTVAVLERLAPQQRGELLGAFHRAMNDSAGELHRLWPSLPERMREEMVMVKGVDSSTWNAHAGALNTMRSAWISAMKACHLEHVFDYYLPGKAPRLMASDLAWGYRNSGQDLHIDTALFAALARPWEVILGDTDQGREDILREADKLGLGSAALDSGWVGPRPVTELERPAAEPALVHGVVVSDPLLADTLRRAGVFSGKKLKATASLP